MQKTCLFPLNISQQITDKQEMLQVLQERILLMVYPIIIGVLISQLSEPYVTETNIAKIYYRA